ncbi:MAG: hypothetical protein DBW72_00100 [Flavobacteriales bacterium]|nr:MAG: hypothetical protein DBW72_00100 [Flavobacteriales bacterium]
MYRVLFLFMLLVKGVFSQMVHPSNNDAFLQDEVASISIEINPEYMETILTDSLYSDYEYPASFTYISSSFTETIPNVGFRLRGNTSRNAEKKSFKVAFNAFVQGQKWNGLEKMNLNGEHNDVSIMRSRLSNQILASADLPCSRTSYVKLFINEEYKGLYINVEHIDDEFLQRRFIDDDEGNLYKCFWGADFNYLGNNQQAYADIYELKTNKTENDYTGLISLIEVINNSSDEDFPCAIWNVFDVEIYLKTLALEILIGHWDGHAVNKNNFYLYQRPSDGKFVFIQYDMDNTFGIDWFDEDWANKNIYFWGENERPLYQRIMNVPYFRDRFNMYMHQLIQNHFNPTDLIGQLINTQSMISDAALADDYKELDYGFSDLDFLNAIEDAFGAHVSYSLNDYITTRNATASFQVEDYLSLEPPCNIGLEELLPESTIISVIDLNGKTINEIDSFHGIYLIVYSNGFVKKYVK